MIRVEALEDKTTTVGGIERRDSLMSFVARIEEHVEGLDNAQQVIVQMVLEMSEDLRAAFRVVTAKVADLSVRLNITMRAVENQTLTGVKYNLTRYRS